MKVNQALKYYKTQDAIAVAAMCGKSLVSKWKSQGGLIPEKYARRLSDDSGGEVPFRHRAYGLRPPTTPKRGRAA